MEDNLSVPGLAKKRDSSGRDGGISSGCLSQPSSPRLSSRLSKITRLISRSDANLDKDSFKAKRDRHDSGDSSQIVPPMSSTPDDGGASPSKASFIVRATGYVTHLKSRIGRHREKSGKNPDNQSLCCGHKRQAESSDTIAGVNPGSASIRSMIDESIVDGSASISVNVSANNSEFGYAVEDADLNNHNYRPSNTSDCIADHNSSSPQTGLFGLTNSSVVTGVSGKSQPNTAMASSSGFPFYTLNVHLQRGKDLVARDACGSSDPYVKVKIGDKLHYKSKTIYRDLNPIWDESFVLPINDLSQNVVFKVFDYDWGCMDDFLGMTVLEPGRLIPNKAQDFNLVLTETLGACRTGAGAPTTESMGEIFVSVTLIPRTIEEKEIWLTDGQSSARLVDSQRRLKSQIWSSVLTVLLLETKNMTNDKEDRLIMDAFVKFRLGNQKYKSRTIPRTSAPKWCEQFDFYLYEGQPQVLEVQVFDEAFSRDYIGRCSIDIGLLAKEITHNQTYQLQEGPGEISLLLTISGTCGAETISDLANYKPSTDETITLRSRYALRRSLHSVKDVGYLTVKVYEATGLVAADIGGKSDPFCVLELNNARLQTQTEYRTLNPMWNKIFTFTVKDYTSLLELTVYDEDRHHKTEFLGKINIPLWKIKNGEKKWFTLKDRKLVRPARGNNPRILIEMELIWNPLRAGIRVMDPPEQKFLQPDIRLKREVFLLNIDRLRKVGMAIYDIMQYIQSCMEWEYPVRSVIALTLYQLICYFFQPFFIPLFLMLIILRQWLVCAVTGAPLPEDFPEDETLVLDDEEDNGDDGDDKKMSLRQKLQAVQDATQTLQNALGDIASFCESTRNTFRLVIPFIAWIAVLALLIATIILYFIPLRYLAMAWGFHKFLRPILRPNVTPTNEVYNLIARVPDNQQLIYYKPLRVLSSPDVQRNRSPPGKTPVAKKTKYKFW